MVQVKYLKLVDEIWWEYFKGLFQFLRVQNLIYCLGFFQGIPGYCEMFLASPLFYWVIAGEVT